MPAHPHPSFAPQMPPSPFQGEGAPVRTLERMRGSLAAWFGAPRSSRPTQLVPRMITALKRFTNQDMQNDLWQGGFHDHIIRSEADYLRIWAYMDQNPAKWREDRYHEEAYP